MFDHLDLFEPQSLAISMANSF